MDSELIPNEEEYMASVMPPRFVEKESPEIGVIRELSPKKVKDQIRMELKGFTYDYELQKYVKIEGQEPLMNDLGIQKFISALSAVTDIVTFSNYTMEDAKKHTLFVMESVIPTIYVNYKGYGIKNKCDLPVLTQKLFVLTYSAFQKAVGAGDRGVIGRTIQENIMTRVGELQATQSLSRERRGFFSRINPFAK